MGLLKSSSIFSAPRLVIYSSNCEDKTQPTAREAIRKGGVEGGEVGEGGVEGGRAKVGRFGKAVWKVGARRWGGSVFTDIGCSPPRVENLASPTGPFPKAHFNQQ